MTGVQTCALPISPIYTFSKDAKPGDTTGDKFKDIWHVIKG